MEHTMKGKYKISKDILFLVALYANLFFGYQYVQELKAENRTIESSIQDLKQKI